MDFLVCYRMGVFKEFVLCMFVFSGGVFLYSEQVYIDCFCWFVVEVVLGFEWPTVGFGMCDGGVEGSSDFF